MKLERILSGEPLTLKPRHFPSSFSTRLGVIWAELKREFTEGFFLKAIKMPKLKSFIDWSRVRDLQAQDPYLMKLRSTIEGLWPLRPRKYERDLSLLTSYAKVILRIQLLRACVCGCKW